MSRHRIEAIHFLGHNQTLQHITKPFVEKKKCINGEKNGRRQRSEESCRMEGQNSALNPLISSPIPIFSRHTFLTSLDL
jgi:hypothetical protein